MLLDEFNCIFNNRFIFAYGVLRRFLPEEKVESVKGLTLTADGNGAVFDVAVEDLDTFLSGGPRPRGDPLPSLAEVEEDEMEAGVEGAEVDESQPVPEVEIHPVPFDDEQPPLPDKQ
ncbi:hypothetical protein SLEP1_g18888 [Rubroshorea leprosula]|uniref:GUCT domain-containing protein n=1 Tax=Rubroshorea leprosula TaxID=152421 RepID=A0AAV5IZ19_9ROSI|nr:hypothetical protein SLEP1_g18888 [Rubroshorea leprosula]